MKLKLYRTERYFKKANQKLSEAVWTYRDRCLTLQQRLQSALDENTALKEKVRIGENRVTLQRLTAQWSDGSQSFLDTYQFMR